MHACMHASCMDVHTYVCVCVGACVCIYVCMYVRMMCERTHACTDGWTDEDGRMDGWMDSWYIVTCVCAHGCKLADGSSMRVHVH